MSVFTALLSLGALSCNSTPPTTILSVNDPQALAFTNNELFISSTNTDELRVLELTVDLDTREPTDAPNPIYPLSIPVVTRPVVLETDTDGVNPGKYIFVLSAVEQRLGIVDAINKVEVQEVSLPGVPLSMSARTLPGPNGGARVFIGLSNGTQGSIVVVTVPPLSQFPVPGLGIDPSIPPITLANTAPAGLTISPDGSTMAIGDRLADETNADPTQRRGGLIEIPLTENSSGLPVAGTPKRIFVGGPVGKVAYNPASADLSGALIPAGTILYALIEGSGCANGHRCGGIQMVVNGQVPEGAPGQPVLPVFIDGVPTDFAVAGATFNADGSFQLPLLNLPPSAGFGGPTNVPLLLGVPSTNGLIYFVDGLQGRIFDTDENGPSFSPVEHFNPDGTILFVQDGGLPDGGLTDGGGILIVPPDGGDNTGPLDITLSEGSIDGQEVLILYQGPLPGLIGRPGTLTLNGATGTLTDLASDFSSLGVLVQDQVRFEGCDLDGGTARVLDIGPDPANNLTVGQLSLDTSTLACPPAGNVTYSVSAGVNEPYTVAGSTDGLFGRVDHDESFASKPAYFYRPPGYDPTKPGLAFRMGSGDPRPGAGWFFDTGSGINPMTSPGGTTAILPGPIVWAPNLRKFYVGYPGSTVTSQVSEVDPALVVQGSDVNIGQYQ
jgi:hypothetical protein